MLSSSFSRPIPLSRRIYARVILLSGNERDNLNFNAMRRMVSIRSRLSITSEYI